MRLFTDKFLEKLHTQFSVNSENKLEFTDLSVKEFLRIFSANKIQQPELIWNDETRDQMRQALGTQLESMSIHVGGESKEHIFTEWLTSLKDFKYEAYASELRIDNIFVKNFNVAVEKIYPIDEFSEEKKRKFAAAIMDAIETKSTDARNTEELIKAFKNLIGSLHYKIQSTELFQEQFGALCRLLLRETSDEDFCKRIARHVFGIVTHIVEQENGNVIYAEGFMPSKHQADRLSMCEIMLENHDFFQLMIRTMSASGAQFVDSDEQVRDLLDTLLLTKPEQVVSLFIERKLILFLL